MLDQYSNIVKFPNGKTVKPSTLQTEDNIVDQIFELESPLAKEISDTLLNYIFGEMQRTGADIDIDDVYPSLTLVMGALQSFQLKLMNIHHSHQDYADKIYRGSDVDLHLITADAQSFDKNDNGDE
jgi:hypothetical protein